MTASARRRGQPVVVLSAVLLGWVAARVAAWHPMQPLPATVPEPPSVVASRLSPGTASSLAPAADPAPWPVRVEVGEIAPGGDPQGRVPAPVPTPALAPSAAPHAPMPVTVAAGHGLLWLAAVSRLPLPPAFLPPAIAGGAAPSARWSAPRAPAAGRGARWSADGWLLLRGRGAPHGAAAFASYGASQLGAVARYRLDPASGHRPMATLRAAAALDGSGEREVALGLAARPLAALSVSLIAELRGTRTTDGAIRVRPAISAVTELAPLSLPLGLRGQVYGQAGYVGGAAATPFADGEVRIDRAVALEGPAEMRLGAAAWGGAQEGAARLDIGPTVSIGISGDGKAARLGLDWRLRVAGKAVPASGPALTLSAGF